MNAEAGPAGSLLDPAELEEWSNDDDLDGMSALSKLNRATRRKLLVQVCCSGIPQNVAENLGDKAGKVLGNLYP